MLYGTTKFLNSPDKSNKNIDKLTTLKSFTCPASAKESHHREKGRDVPISKTRLTYGMEIDDGSNKEEIDSLSMFCPLPYLSEIVPLQR